MLRREWCYFIDPAAVPFPEVAARAHYDKAHRQTVPFVPFACPSCGHSKPQTVGSSKRRGVGRVRYHICQACNLVYDSVETRVLPPDGAVASDDDDDSS